VRQIASLAICSAALVLAGCTAGESQGQESPAVPLLAETPVSVESQATSTAEVVQPSPEPVEPTSADADVLEVRAVLDEDGTWTFYVTVGHPDTGWDDYADGWDVVTENGDVLKQSDDDVFTRLLLHPHENEQPFTRGQRGINVPESLTSLTVRAHDIVDGFGGIEVAVDLTTAAGPNFMVERN